MPQSSAGYSLKAVHELAEGDFWRIVHEQMHVVILSIHLDKLRLEIRAHARKQVSHIIQDLFGKHSAPVFGHEDQMSVKGKNTMSALPIIVVIRHRPMICWGL